MERVGEDLVGLHCFGLLVADVDCVVVGAGRGGELAAVDADGGKGYGAVGVDGVGAVLPLHY